MSRARRIRGREAQCVSPEWQPLLDFAPEHIDDFMWMFEVELDRGSRLHAYKHYWTRRYIHLDHEGRAFAYCGDELYQEVDPLGQLDLVLQKERDGPRHMILSDKISGPAGSRSAGRDRQRSTASPAKDRPMSSRTVICFSRSTQRSGVPLSGRSRASSFSVRTRTVSSSRSSRSNWRRRPCW